MAFGGEMEEEEKGFITRMLPLLSLLFIANRGERGAHGYDLIKHFRRSLSYYAAPSQIYPLLQGFERNGLLTSKWAFPNGRPRRVYTCTPKALRLLNRLRSRLSVEGYMGNG